MKELTEQERKRIEQYRLRADWMEQGFRRQVLGRNGQWITVNDKDEFWDDRPAAEYRREPSMKYVPWTRDDADEFRGIWVKDKNNVECLIFAFDPDTSGCGALRMNGGWFSLIELFEDFTKLDGTPCGKLEESK